MKAEKHEVSRANCRQVLYLSLQSKPVQCFKYNYLYGDVTESSTYSTLELSGDHEKIIFKNYKPREKYMELIEPDLGLIKNWSKNVN